jgi:hypothetical protein
MFFPPIEVKRVRLEEADQADGMMTATWGRRRELSGCRDG